MDNGMVCFSSLNNTITGSTTSQKGVIDCPKNFADPISYSALLYSTLGLFGAIVSALL